MSVSMDMIVELLPLSSKLQRADNPLRVVLDRTVGEWLDNFSQPFEQLFLTSATGGWLDAHGRDYGVPRKIDEDDDSYRQRIVYEKLDHLTPSLLSDVYSVKLFTYRTDFNVKYNTLVSDNPHIVQGNSFIGASDEDTIRILDKKFILDSVITWVNEYGSVDYLLDSRGVNILSEYSKIYELTNGYRYFYKNTTIKKVQLFLPNMNTCNQIFRECSNLESVKLILPNISYMTLLFSNCTNLKSLELSSYVSDADYLCSDSNLSSLKNVKLDLPNVISCVEMLRGCSALKNVYLNLPKLDDYSNMFNNDSNIETIDVTIPVSKVSGFKSYVTGLNLQYLTSFIINGEEQL